jgi:hypothetical protein
MAKERKSRKDLDPSQVAILATLQDAQGLRNNRRNTLRAAARLIEDVPKCLDPNPDWEHQTLDERFATFWAEEDAKLAEAKSWGFPGPVEDAGPLPEGAFSFDLAVRQSWCDYTTELHFVRLLRKFGYPEKLIARGAITKAGYERIMALKRARKLAYDRDLKREARKKQVLEPKKRNL